MAISVQRGHPAIQAPVSARSAEDRTGRVAIFLFFAGVVLSTTLAASVFDLSISADRIVLLVMFVPILTALGQARSLRIQAFDYLIFATAAWIIIALMVDNGPERGLKYGGSVAVESVGAYLLARVYVRNFAQFAFAVRTYFLFVVIAGVIALPETFLGAKLITGLGPAVAAENTGRLGLFRATSGFAHPILYGTFCSTLFGLVWYLYSDSPRRWLLTAAVVGITFLALSSAPLLGCMFAVAIMLWEKYTRNISNRVAITLSIIGGGYVLVGAFSNRSPIEVLLPFISLDPWTAYYRLFIWQYAMMNITAHPIFGLGLNEWVRPAWMPESVDSLWLTMMLLGGMPTVLFLASGMVVLMVRAHRRPAHAESRERWQARFGWTAAVLSLCLQAFTVHYWGAMYAMFYFVLGLGAWLTDTSSPAQATPIAKPEERRRPLVAARMQPIGRRT